MLFTIVQYVIKLNYNFLTSSSPAEQAQFQFPQPSPSNETLAFNQERK